MKKILLAGTAALAIAGASFAYAQQPPRGPDRGWRPSVEDMSAFTDARIAGLKAGLKLTPDQEKNWPAVETALRDLAKQRAERAMARADAREKAAGAKPEDRAAAPPRDPIAGLRQRADMMTQTGANLKKLADAAGPLYNSLDEAQKRRFTMLSRVGMRDMGGFERGGERHGPRHHPRGPRGERDGGPRPL
jgi:hypothetical protein